MGVTGSGVKESDCTGGAGALQEWLGLFSAETKGGTDSMGHHRGQSDQADMTTQWRGLLISPGHDTNPVVNPWL